jgi:RHS repeat-associated protein
LYTGEQYDGAADQYYLRARYYNPANGTFNRVDPYSGNMQDPQSLHKYAYVHNNPVNGIDPSGRMFTVMGVVKVVAIIAVLYFAARLITTEKFSRTDSVVLYLEPGSSNLRNGIIATKANIESHFSNIVKLTVREGTLSVDDRGYDSGLNEYKISVAFQKSLKLYGKEILGNGVYGLVQLNTTSFDEQVEDYSGSNRDNIAANVLAHEVVHAIYSNGSLLRTFPDHEGSGLMQGPPFSRTGFPRDEAQNGLIPFSSTTRKRLRTAVGKRF